MTDRARILHWISTGENEFKTNHGRHKIVDGTSIILEGDQCPLAAVASESSAHSQGSALTPLGSSGSENPSSHSQDELLIGCEGDPLIPTTEEVNRTCLKAQNLWRTLVKEASSFLSGCLPTSSLDPSIMMQNVPPLPWDLSGQLSIKGQSVWDVASSGIKTLAFEQKDDGWDPDLAYGVQKDFDLWISEPTKIGITWQNNIFRHCTSGVQPPEDAPNGLAICTICWAYIISARLLEMRKKSKKFCSTTLVPVLAKDLNSQPNDIVIDLGCASAGLVRWLCTILAPDSRWHVQRLPPWATIYEGDYRFVVVASSIHSWDENYEPPSSKQATQFLIELGTLFGLESQITGGFLSALMLPVHNIMKLKPQLPLPRLTKAFEARATMSSCIRDCMLKFVSNLSYYMTLSICPSLSSAIWSIFWEPGIDCNLVSAWLGSIHHVIQPILEVGDLEMLAKVFALYRPRLAPLWLGIALLGCTEFTGMIKSYLTTLEERPFFCRLSRPDPDVAAWTGSPQSFLDEAGLGCYNKDGEVLLSRSDLYRLRFNYCWLSNKYATAPFGWQPIGSVRKKDVELELQEQLEEWRPRKYLRWIWYTKQGKIEHSFCDKYQDTIETSRILSSLDHSLTETSNGTSCAIKLWPSKEATWRILVWGSRTASGDEDSIEEITKHGWLKDAR